MAVDIQLPIRDSGIVTKKEAAKILGVRGREFNNRMEHDPNFPKASDGNRKRRWLCDDILVYKVIMRQHGYK
jgi:hypothetical protein